MFLRQLAEARKIIMHGGDLGWRLRRWRETLKTKRPRNHLGSAAHSFTREGQLSKDKARIFTLNWKVCIGVMVLLIWKNEIVTMLHTIVNGFLTASGDTLRHKNLLLCKYKFTHARQVWALHGKNESKVARTCRGIPY